MRLREVDIAAESLGKQEAGQSACIGLSGRRAGWVESIEGCS